MCFLIYDGGILNPPVFLSCIMGYDLYSYSIIKDNIDIMINQYLNFRNIGDTETSNSPSSRFKLGLYILIY